MITMLPMLKTGFSFVKSNWILFLVIGFVAYAHFRVEGLKDDVADAQAKTVQVEKDLQAANDTLEAIKQRGDELQAQIEAAAKTGQQVRNRTQKKADSVIEKPSFPRASLETEIKELVTEWEN